jgi:Bacterial Ig-like domain/FG-GAP-like repeat/FlgD Ig-like domain
MTTTVARATATLALTLTGFLANPQWVVAAPPQVSSSFPLRQKIDVPVNTVIQVTFDSDINPATVNALTFRVFGRWSGPAGGTFDVVGGSVTFTPTEPFFAGEWITVTLSKGIQNLTGQGLVKGYAWNFWTKTAAALLDLEYVGRVTARQGNETWVSPYGAYAGDLDNDGWGDITVINEQTADVRVYMSSSGSFSGFASENLTDGLVPSPNEMGDFDNDGEIDLVVGNVNNDKISILFGDGTGDFPNGRKTSYTAGASVRGVGVLDLNGDGWDDIVTANRSASNLSIFLNNGDGTFAPAVAKEAGGSGEFSIAVADANNDGRLDVFCGIFNIPRSIIVLLSDGNGGLTAQPPVGVSGRPWQTIVGDLNNDGNVDVATDDTDGGRVAVLIGNGLGGLGAPTYYLSGGSIGSYPLAIDAGDIDGDGDLELVSSNYSVGTWTLFENSAGVFVNPRTLNSSTSGSCATLHDRNNDGALDITGVDEIDDWVYFFQNDPLPTGVRPAGVTVALLQNHPNPFNPSTTIAFTLATPAQVELTIFDARGARVTTLAHGAYPAGTTDVRWNGTDSDGRPVSSGVYFCRLATGREVLTRKMVLLK